MRTKTYLLALALLFSFCTNPYSANAEHFDKWEDGDIFFGLRFYKSDDDLFGANIDFDRERATTQSNTITSSCIIDGHESILTVIFKDASCQDAIALSTMTYVASDETEQFYSDAFREITDKWGEVEGSFFCG